MLCSEFSLVYKIKRLCTCRNLYQMKARCVQWKGRKGSGMCTYRSIFSPFSRVCRHEILKMKAKTEIEGLFHVGCMVRQHYWTWNVISEASCFKACRAHLPLPSIRTRKKRFLSQNFTNVQLNPHHLFVCTEANQSRWEN